MRFLSVLAGVVMGSPSVTVNENGQNKQLYFVGPGAGGGGNNLAMSHGGRAYLATSD